MCMLIKWQAINFKIVQCAVTFDGIHPLVVCSLGICGERPLGHRYRMESDNSQANHYRKNNKKNHIFLEFAINYYIGTQETFQTAENLGSLSNVLQGWSWQVVVPQIIYLKRKTHFSKISPQFHVKYQNLKMVYFYIPIKHPILASKYCILDLKSPYIP